MLGQETLNPIHEIALARAKGPTTTKPLIPLTTTLSPSGGYAMPAEQPPKLGNIMKGLKIEKRPGAV